MLHFTQKTGNISPVPTISQGASLSKGLKINREINIGMRDLSHRYLESSLDLRAGTFKSQVKMCLLIVQQDRRQKEFKRFNYIREKAQLSNIYICIHWDATCRLQ